MTTEGGSLFHHAETIGDLRELTADLADDTPIVVVIRKAHDPDHFYEAVPVEAGSMVDLMAGVIELTIPEPGDLGD